MINTTWSIQIHLVSISIYATFFSCLFILLTAPASTLKIEQYSLLRLHKTKNLSYGKFKPIITVYFSIQCTLFSGDILR